MKLYKVIETDDSTGLDEQVIYIRVLNSKESYVVPNHMVASLYEPDPSDILNHPHGTDGAMMVIHESIKDKRNMGDPRFRLFRT